MEVSERSTLRDRLALTLFKGGRVGEARDGFEAGREKKRRKRGRTKDQKLDSLG